MSIDWGTAFGAYANMARSLDKDLAEEERFNKTYGLQERGVKLQEAEGDRKQQEHEYTKKVRQAQEDHGKRWSAVLQRIDQGDFSDVPVLMKQYNSNLGPYADNHSVAMQSGLGGKQIANVIGPDGKAVRSVEMTPQNIRDHALQMAAMEYATLPGGNFGQYADKQMEHGLKGREISTREEGNRIMDAHRQSQGRLIDEQIRTGNFGSLAANQAHAGYYGTLGTQATAAGARQAKMDELGAFIANTTQALTNPNLNPDRRASLEASLKGAVIQREAMDRNFDPRVALGYGTKGNGIEQDLTQSQKMTYNWLLNGVQAAEAAAAKAEPGTPQAAAAALASRKATAALFDWQKSAGIAPEGVPRWQAIGLPDPIETAKSAMVSAKNEKEFVQSMQQFDDLYGNDPDAAQARQAMSAYVNKWRMPRQKRSLGDVIDPSGFAGSWR